MEVKINNSYLELLFDEVKFFLDPPSLNQKEGIIILTDITKNINKDLIFNCPGEYNVGDVYFYGFLNEKSITYLLLGKEGNLLYLKENLNNDVFKRIKLLTKEIDGLVAMDFFDQNLVSYFKPNVILTNKNINIEKFDKQKGNKFKINLKKVKNLICILA